MSTEHPVFHLVTLPEGQNPPQVRNIAPGYLLLTASYSPLRSFSVFSFSFILFFIVVQLQLSAFPPHNSPQPQSNSPPSLVSTLLLVFVHVSFILVPENPQKLLIHIYPLTS